MPLLDPRTGLPLDTNPDEVDPNALPLQPSPVPPRDAVDPTGTGAPPVDPNAPPVSLSDLASKAAGVIFPTAGQPGFNVPPAAASPPRVTAPALPPAVLSPPANEQGAAPPAPVSFPAAVKDTYVKPTKNEPALQKKLDQAEAKERTAAGKASDTKIGSAQAEVTGVQAEADAIAKANQDASAARKQAQDAYDAGQKELAQQRDQTIKSGAKGYWEDKSTGAFLAAALMEGIGQFASAFTGGPNQALNVINTAVDRDAAAKREKTRNELEALGLKGKELERRLALADVEITNGKAAALESLAAQRGVRLAKANVGQAEAEKDVIQSSLLKQSAADKLKAEESLRHHITTDTEPSIRAAAAAGHDGGRADKVRIDKATLVSQLEDDFDNLKAQGGYKLSAKARQRISKNDELMHAQAGKAGYAMARGVLPGSLVPTNRYEGLTRREAAIANSLRLMAEKAASLNYEAGGGKSMEQLLKEFDATVPGEGTIDQKVGNIRNTMKSNAALAGKYMDIARKGKAGGESAPQRLSPQGIARLNVALKTASPDESAQIRQVLASGVR